MARSLSLKGVLVEGGDMFPREGFIVIVVESSGLLRTKLSPTRARNPMVFGVVGVEGTNGAYGILSE